MRGIGLSPLRASCRCDFGYAEIAEDFTTLADALRASSPNVPLIVGGHSLGGHVALLAAAEARNIADRMLLIASGAPYYGFYQRPYRYGLFVTPYFFRMVAAVVGYLPGYRLGFMGNEARTLVREWGGVVTTNRFEIGNRAFDHEAALASLDMRIDSICFQHDTLTPAPATEGLVARCGAASIENHKLGDNELGFRAGHFSWAKNGEPLWPLLTKMLSL